jgi:hypothetical protein
VALAEKRFSDGEALARQSAAAYEKSNSWGNAAWAEAILARNLLGENKLADAQNAVAKAMKLSQQSAGQSPRYEGALANARVKAKSGKIGEAQKELEAMNASAHKFGYRLYEYQARLALGEIELSSGSAAASVHLAALEKDARAHGALLVANQAHALLEQRGATT